MANITVSAPVSNVTVDSTTNTVTVSQSTSNVIVGQATTVAVDETIVNNGNLGGNITLNVDAGRIHLGTLTSNITGITLANISAGKSLEIIFTQDVTGGHILDTTTTPANWANWDFVNDYTEFDTNPNNFNIISVIYNGTTYYASLAVDSAVQVNTAEIADGAVTNPKLANSNIVINGTAVDLGGNITVTANMDLTALSVTEVAPSGNGSLSYSNITGVFTFTPADTSNAGIQLTDLSVTENAPSGNGTLSYNNTSGVFSFTPADVPNTTDELTEGVTNLYYSNTRVNAFIQDSITTSDIDEGTNLYYTTGRANTAISTYFNDSGNAPYVFAGNVEVQGNLNYQNVTDLYVTDQKITLNANAASDATVEIIANRPVAGANTILRWNETSDIWEFTNDGSTYYPIPASTSDLTEGSNLYWTTDRGNAAILNYSGDISRMYQANISRISVGGGNIDLDSALLTFPDLQFYSESSGERYFIGAQLSAATTTGITDAYVRSRGNISAPGVISSNDRIYERDYYVHDGTSYLQTFGEHIYQDSATGAVSTGVIPLAYEIYTQQDGVSGGFDQSIVKFRSDRTIAFNDTGTRGFGTGAGNANIQMDGTINTVADINAGGNIVAVTFTGDGSDLTSVRAETIEVTIKNADTVTIPKGYPVHATGTSVGGEVEVVLADAGNSALMPAHFIANEELTSTGDTGRGILSGLISGVDTSSFSVGDTIFVAVGGGYANVAPSGEANLIQNLGVVTDVAVSGSGEVYGAGRATATPALNEGNIFIGNASNDSVTAVFTDEANSAILNYTGNITQLNEANVSRLYVAQDNLGLDSGLGTFFDLQMVKQNDQYFTAKQLSRNTTTGITEAIIKSRGTVSAPTVISAYDRIHEVDYYSHDGTNYVQTFGEHIYQDAVTGSVSTGTIPLAMEIYTKQNGDSSTFDQSLVKFRADRTIAFNDNATRGFGTGAGNANIQMDGTIWTASNVNVGGTLKTSIIRNQDSDPTGNIAVYSNVQLDDNYIFSAGSSGDLEIYHDGANSIIKNNTGLLKINDLAYPSVDGSNGQVLTTNGAGTLTFTDAGAVYGNVEVENFLSANVITSDIVTQGNLNINKDITADSDVLAANAIFADKLYSYTPGGTFTMTALRVNDFKANDPLGIDSVANSSLNSGVYAAPFTGSIVFVTGDRTVAGDGVPAYWSGNAWKYFSDDANVVI